MVRIVGLPRGIPTGGVCPPIRLVNTFFDFRKICSAQWLSCGQAPPTRGLLDRRQEGVGPRGLAGWLAGGRSATAAGVVVLSKRLGLTRRILRRMFKFCLIYLWSKVGTVWHGILLRGPSTARCWYGWMDGSCQAVEDDRHKQRHDN